MLAQANIAEAVFVHAGSGDMAKPYYRPANFSIRNSVGYLMRMAVNRLTPQMEALFEDQELTFTQWTTLVTLYDGRITTAGDLAHNICHDAGSLTRLTDQMVKRGFVSRQRCEDDRRSVRLALTPRGRAMVEALAPKVMDFWNNMVSGFSHSEMDALISLLTRLVITAEGAKRRSSRLLLSDTPVFPAKKKKSS
jgi:DNA-binding MarR family transcriptional regulator